MEFRDAATLDAHLPHLREAPAEVGTLDMVVRRPAVDEREVLTEATLSQDGGLDGDNWLDRSTSRAIESGRHLDAQINVMSARMASFLAFDDVDRWALAGDQLFLDLDLSHENLPTGTRIAIGEDAVIEVTKKPHNGCAKFRARYGQDALDFVNSETGQAMRLRGFNARVVSDGTVRPGDKVTRL
ncbi:MOSC domain-containing protein [Nocardioides panacisoli]|uniref:MOSC domain-containing protein n=1 Tax=Nocardioides panacisoli TaxID=627624 RepID=UPI001C62AB79|nr:MOSC domain-containing protein [Nocardioides panacisoli]QYJ04507.1 MOSC domain-containing protein [Nocardioides panacisoli]